MNRSSTMSASLACLIISATCLMNTPHARAIDPITGAGLAAFAASLYVYRSAEQFDGPDRYNVAELKQALNDYLDCKDRAKNLVIIRKNLRYLVADGLIGHSSKMGSVRFNDKIGKHEIPAIPSRGVYGYVHDLVLPATQVAEFWKELVAFIIALEIGKQVWLNNQNPITKVQEFVRKAMTTDAVPANDIAALKAFANPGGVTTPPATSK